MLTEGRMNKIIITALLALSSSNVYAKSHIEPNAKGSTHTSKSSYPITAKGDVIEQYFGLLDALGKKVLLKYFDFFSTV